MVKNKKKNLKSSRNEVSLRPKLNFLNPLMLKKKQTIQTTTIKTIKFQQYIEQI